MQRRLFLFGVAALTPTLLKAHSPWGQYQVYRQKHLLILSTRDDKKSYPYSKTLAAAINISAPEAKARPARAVNLKRAYDLLRTKQFTFALLPADQLEKIRGGQVDDSINAKVDLRTIYSFGELEFVVQYDFPEQLVKIVAHAVAKNRNKVPEAASPQTVLKNNYLHPAASAALKEFL